MISLKDYNSITPEQFRKIFPAAPRAAEKSEKATFYGKLFSSLEWVGPSLAILAAKVEVFFQTNGKVWVTFQRTVSYLDLTSRACSNMDANQTQALKTPKVVLGILNQSIEKERNLLLEEDLNKISGRFDALEREAISRLSLEDLDRILADANSDEAFLSNDIIKQCFLILIENNRTISRRMWTLAVDREDFDFSGLENSVFSAFRYYDCSSLLTKKGFSSLNLSDQNWKILIEERLRYCFSLLEHFSEESLSAFLCRLEKSHPNHLIFTPEECIPKIPKIFCQKTVHIKRIQKD